MKELLLCDLMAKVLNADVDQVKKIGGDESFEEYGMDSILSIRFILLIEEKYKIEFDDDDLLFDKYNTICKLTQLMMNY